MDWKTILIIIIAIVGVILWKRMSLISVDVARKYLREGAVIVDVRSPEEFRGDHLRDAINIPLGNLNRLPEVVRDKGSILLLHCLSGARSGMAEGKIKAMGYQHVFNMGSLDRAKMILSGVGSN